MNSGDGSRLNTPPAIHRPPQCSTLTFGVAGGRPGVVGRIPRDPAPCTDIPSQKIYLCWPVHTVTIDGVTVDPLAYTVASPEDLVPYLHSTEWSCRHHSCPLCSKCITLVDPLPAAETPLRSFGMLIWNCDPGKRSRSEGHQGVAKVRFCYWPERWTLPAAA